MNTGIACFSAFFLGISLGLLSQNMPKSTVKKRRKKKKKVSKPPVQSSDLTGITSLVPKQKSGIELESSDILEQIYQDDLTVHSRTPEVKFSIFLYSKSVELKNVVCSIYLSVTFPKRYPQVAPVLEIQNPVGIQTPFFQQLKDQLQAKLKYFISLNKQIVYETTIWLRQELDKLNPTPPPSPLTTQMVKVEESLEDSGLDLEKQIKEELISRVYKPDEPILLNSVTNLKNLEKELNDSPIRVPQGITGFDYRSYFEQNELIGKGGGGSVYRVTNKIDECVYAVKIVKLKGMKASAQIMKEVLVLSKLQHPNIVRYHNAWFEENSDSEESENSEDSYESSSNSESSSQSENWIVAFQRSRGSIEPFFSEKQSKNKGCKLYIQMEFCAGNSLQEVIQSDLPDESTSFKMLKEILNGLVYIHSKKTIHRDLKPSNIFLGGEGEVKLGDFGLATTSEAEAEISTVGTPFYWSPEQELGRCDQKSDLFSIGIIFFELWRKFGSYMQRSKEIKALTKQRLLPSDFEAPENVKKIIIWLTEPDPANRPTAEQLLLSSYMPHQIDKKKFEEFLIVATRPNSLENQWMFQEIFKQVNQTKIEFTYNVSNVVNSVQALSRRKTKIDSMLKAAVEQKLKEYFSNAGAVEIKTPVLFPFYPSFSISVLGKDRKWGKVTVEHSKDIEKLIERAGIIVQLPDNCVVPWARKVAKMEYGGVVKRYAVQTVYKTSGNREHPREVVQASLDYCFDRSSYSEDLKFVLKSEMLFVSITALKDILHEVLERHGGIIEVQVNDTRIIDYLCDYLEIKPEVRVPVLKIIASIHKLNSKSLKEKLSQLGLSSSIISKFEKYFRVQGNLKFVSEKLKETQIKNDKVYLKLFNEELKEMIRMFEIFDIAREGNIVFNLGLLNEDLYHYSGFICAIVYKGSSLSKKKNLILAYGGCYDNLISHYSIPGKGNKLSDVSGVGIVFNYDLIISILLQTRGFEWIRGPAVFLKSENSFGKIENIDSFKEEIDIVKNLWKNGVSAIYNYNEMTEKTILEICKRYKIRCSLVVSVSVLQVKSASADSTGSKNPSADSEKPEEKKEVKLTLTDYTNAKNQSFDVEKNEVIKKVKSLIPEKLYYLTKGEKYDDLSD